MGSTSEPGGGKALEGIRLHHLGLEVRTPHLQKPNDLIKVTQAGPRTQASGCLALPQRAPTGQGTLPPAALSQRAQKGSSTLIRCHVGP